MMSDSESRDVAAGDLVVAAGNGDVGGVQAALDNDVAVDSPALECGSQRTALWVAACRGHRKVVKLLLQSGASVNLRSSADLSTPLCAAAQYSRTDTLKLLLKHDADAAIQTRHGKTALMLAAQTGRAIERFGVVVGFQDAPALRLLLQRRSAAQVGLNCQ